ncbi:MAG TPA: hypothetical protein VGS61_06975, partial [Acidimicrobiales bacterium]|nr:hypothetical protein [Acidimicrobiales bacterium]
VPAISLDVPAYGEAEAVITPNSSIPAAGLARVRVAASEPVVATLAAGSSSGVALTPAFTPTALVLLGGFDASYAHEIVANSSARDAIGLRVVRSFAVPGGTPARPAPGPSSLRLGAGAVVDALGAGAGLTTSNCRAAVVEATRPDLVIAQVLTSTPSGVEVVSGSPG